MTMAHSQKGLRTPVTRVPEPLGPGGGGSLHLLHQAGNFLTGPYNGVCETLGLTHTALRSCRCCSSIFIRTTIPVHLLVPPILRLGTQFDREFKKLVFCCSVSLSDLRNLKGGTHGRNPVERSARVPPGQPSAVSELVQLEASDRGTWLLSCFSSPSVCWLLTSVPWSITRT